VEFTDTEKDRINTETLEELGLIKSNVTQQPVALKEKYV